MFIDSNLEFADDKAVPTTGTGTQNLMIGEIDLRPAGEDSDASPVKTVDFSAGEPIYLVIEVTTAIAGAGSQYAFSLFTDDVETSAGATSSGSQIFDTGLSTTNRTAGKRIIVTLPKADYQRYLTLHGRSDNATAPTSGKINAFITKDVVNWSSTTTRVPATDPAN
jgi:hypothetical protein